MNMHLLFCTYFRKTRSCHKVLALVFSFDCSFGKKTNFCCWFHFLELLNTGGFCLPRGADHYLQCVILMLWWENGKQRPMCWFRIQPFKNCFFMSTFGTGQTECLQWCLSFSWSLLFEVTVLKSLWCLLLGVFLLILITYTGKKRVSPPYQAVL